MFARYWLCPITKLTANTFGKYESPKSVCQTLHPASRPSLIRFPFGGVLKFYVCTLAGAVGCKKETRKLKRERANVSNGKL